MKRVWRSSYGTYLGLILYSLFCLLPLYWIVSLSLKTGQDVIAVPAKVWFHPSLANFAALFGHGARTGFFSSQVDFSGYYVNSLYTAVPAVALAILLGTPAAYAITQLRKLRTAGRFYFFFLSLYFMPPLTVLIPLYLVYQQLGLYNTYAGQTLILQLITLPLVVLILYSFFRDLPKEIEESALLDGCDRWLFFWRVALPLVRPGIATAALLGLIFSWQNFVFGYLLADQATQPVTVGILGFMNYQNVLWGQMAAGVVVATAPLVVMILLMQRHLVTGLSLGAVKE